MTPFCKVDSPTYFIRGMASFFKYFFCHNFLENEKNFFFTYCH
ncbi:unnamed protein product, partial [Staurois parvus]